jgi:FMN phosphatase YigB (HAD superfamily)
LNKLDSLGIRKNTIGNHDTGDACKKLGLLDLYYEELEKHVKVHHALRDEVKELFKRLKKDDKHIAIASDSMRRTIMLYLKKYKLSDQVYFIFSAEEIGCKKDDERYWKKLIE